MFSSDNAHGLYETLNATEQAKFITQFSGSLSFVPGTQRTQGSLRLINALNNLVNLKLDWITANEPNGTSISNRLRQTFQTFNLSSINDLRSYTNLTAALLQQLNSTAVSINYWSRQNYSIFENFQDDTLSAATSVFDMSSFVPNLAVFNKVYTNFTTTFNITLWFVNSVIIYSPQQLDLASMIVEMPDNVTAQVRYVEYYKN